MKSSAKLTVLFTLLAAFSLVGIAGAHTLKVSRAAKANKTFTRLLCKASDDEESSCVASKPGGCHRISAHRVRCSLFLTLESKVDGSRARCRALMEWLLRNKRRGLYPSFLGIKSCKSLRGPQTEPEPAPEPTG